MQCPNDQTTLAMTNRQCIEIDYCPTCRGVWLDRGELDKLIENSSPKESHQPQHQAPPSQPQHYQEQRYDDNYNSGGHYQKKRKKESFLGDIFDF